ncbi:uncharacterized protein LOC122504783 [Leptopilina heterotoma]|uniref:uncharacterized protein LOC122504783 n=1 Tax=Leptopilina heterotoma TaxID=63436 RepID=UPI001CA8706B|nr:uncharacterized protein LOC122504783 [Leptopilina heterotoma]
MSSHLTSKNFLGADSDSDTETELLSHDLNDDGDANSNDGEMETEKAIDSAQVTTENEDLKKKVLKLQEELQNYKRKASTSKELDFQDDDKDDESSNSSEPEERQVKKKKIRPRRNIRDITEYESDEGEILLDDVGNKKKYQIFTATTTEGKKVKRIHLGNGVHIKFSTWKLLVDVADSSSFVKQLSKAIWPDNVLVNRYVKNNNPSLIQLPNRTPRKQLTPSKKETLTKCYRDFLESRDELDTTQRQDEFKRHGRFLSDRIKYLREKLYPELKNKA